MADMRGGILIADSHRLCRGGLKSLLSSDLGIADVTGVDDFPTALAELDRDRKITVLLVDSGLPGMGGMDGLRRIRLRRPELRIVVIAWRQDRSDAFEALAAGAHGYIPKDLPDDEMVQALQTVLGGQIYVPPIISDVTVTTTSTGHDGTLEGELTLRQKEVLTHLAAGLSNKEIARVLNIAEGTVKVHITAAFRALHVHNRVGAVTAMQKIKESGRASQPELPGLKEDGVDKGGTANPLAKLLAAGLPLLTGQAWLMDSGLLSGFL
ncbi:DNA-binding NarL/FixJ family response regulator [Brevundimonas lenta]|uniref:DNA-binding NarL/FixJ family response regulator n=2 Tax=Brevundimonas lenta TaxID=424796 RepID=A0A7W6JGE7_9CAUL|nr:DNA-binding NarL/FixJ family response regulator [Brevundimonas lenta]